MLECNIRTALSISYCQGLSSSETACRSPFFYDVVLTGSQHSKMLLSETQYFQGV